MDDRDKFDNPHPGRDDSDLYGDSPMERVQDMAEQVKPYGKYIVIGIVLLLVAFFAFDFFIGSVKQVSFNVTDTEGEGIAGIITIADSGGKQIDRVRSNETISLKNGTYNVDVRASGYRRLNTQINVIGNAPIPIQLEIEDDLELRGTFPGELFTGEQRELELTIVNNESDVIGTSLVLEGDAKDAMELVYEEPLLVFPGENNVKVTLKVKEKPEPALIGTGNDGELRLKGLDNPKEKIGGKFSLTAFDARDVSVRVGSSNRNADFGTLQAGETSEKEIRIENKSKTVLTNVTIEIEITTTEFTAPEEVKEWFTLNPENTIDTIRAGETKTIIVNLAVPSNMFFATGKEKETIDGRIIVKTTYFEQEFNIDLEVKKPDIGVSIGGIKESYVLKKTNEIYDSELDFIEITNTGDVLLTNLEAAIVCTPSSSTWLTIDNGKAQAMFSSLAPEETRNVQFQISVPPNIPSGTFANCNIGVFYNDPSAQRLSTEQRILISTS